MKTNQFAALKSAIRHGRTTSSRFKRDQAMRIASQLGYTGILKCTFVRGFIANKLEDGEIMLIFFDTEFTEIGIDPRLISIGLISEQGDRTFYGELADTYQPKDCSDFVREAVLPHLEGGAVRMTMDELTLRLGSWIEGFEQPVQLATDSLSWDWEWVRELFCIPGTWPENLDGKPLHLAQSPEFNLAVEKAFASGLRRHHALDDAKANMAGWRALAKNNGPDVVVRWSV